MKKKIQKVLTAFVAMCVLVTSVGISAVFAKTDEYTVLDVSKKTSVTQAFEKFSANTKTVKEGSKYSAMWKTSDIAVATLPLPKDITPYTELKFSVYSEIDCTLHIRINSEDQTSEGTDYYGKMYNLKKGWQDLSINIGSDLKKNRTPRGYNDVDSLTFSAQGWGQTNDYSKMTLYFDSIFLVNNPSYQKLTAEEPAPAETIEKNIGDKVFVNRTFDEEGMQPLDGLSDVLKTGNTVTAAEKDGNKYLLFNAGGSENFYIEQTFKSTSTAFVVEMDIATDTGMEASVQYKDKARKTGELITIYGYDIRINKQPVATLKKGKWTNVKIVFDILKRTETVYIDDKPVKENESYSSDSELGLPILMRFFMGVNSKGVNAMLDNFKVYEGDKVRDIGEMQAAAEEKAVVGEDVEMKWPSVKDIGGGAALMLNLPDAYAKGKLTKIDEQNDAVVPVVKNDRTLVPVRFIAESFDADVSWNQAESKATVIMGGKKIEMVLGKSEIVIDGVSQMLDVAPEVINDRTFLPLRALVEAIGKNVLWDPRGLIVITEPDIVLDSEKDIKLSTMLIGYLKTKKEVSNYNLDPMFTQEIIDLACKAEPGYFTAANGNARTGEYGANALYYLSLITRFDPSAKSSSGQSVKDAALIQLRSLIKGGNEPFACTGCYWSHAVVASSFVLIKNTPELYNELTDEEKARMDTLMGALAIAGNWGYNDLNNYKTGPDLLGNFGKSYNPNYRNTYLSAVLSASMYFGADELDKIFTGFDYDEYMKKLETYGYTNIINRWKNAGKELMENGGACKLVGGVDDRFQSGQEGGSGAGVKIAFKYNGMGAGDWVGLFENLVDFTYSYKVINSFGVEGEKDYAYIISGAKSPYIGQMGMMKEFAGSDANGKRSRPSYCYDSFMILATVTANMKMFGGWDSSTEKMRFLDNRMYVGNEDFIFKISEGYMGHSRGSSSAEYEYTTEPRGYRFTKDIWRNFDMMGNEKVTIKTMSDLKGLDPVEPAEPKDNITEPPARAYVSKTYTDNAPTDSFYALDNGYKKAEMEFDVVLGDNVSDSAYNCVIAFDKAKEGAKWADFNMAVQFKDGTINVMNKDKYQEGKMRTASNYRYHFKVLFDTEKQTYSVWAAQTYPDNKTDSVCLAENASFRVSAGGIDAVSSICVLQNNGSSSGLWVENLKVTQK